MLSYKETRAEFLNSQAWQERLCMEHGITQEYIANDIEDFLTLLQKQDQFPRKLSDTKRFYTSRLDKFMKKQLEDHKQNDQRRKKITTI